ncbi:MAG: hydroxyisourate hydrolase [Armatimonadetes bacterium]|nr:hydroxyisourate hydrolase [Armatimonadota bacterium]
MERRPFISTHVLDAAKGEPARGVRVELYREGALLSTQETNADGRITDLAGGNLRAGTYRLVFHVPSPFFKRLEVEFAVTDTGRPYHIPLLLSPYGCTTYRGS